MRAAAGAIDTRVRLSIERVGDPLKGGLRYHWVILRYIQRRFSLITKGCCKSSWVSAARRHDTRCLNYLMTAPHAER